MTGIIFHHYATSPFSEKVRVAFGIKSLGWQGVTVPVIMPKPDLLPLTGGYRKTPVMQIGADIYCDTQLILRELDRRWPDKPLGTGGIDEGTAYWADHQLFGAAVAVAFGAMGPNLPDAFLADRAAFSGRSIDREKIKMQAAVMTGPLLAHLSWAERTLQDGRAYLGGDKPGVADLAVYHPVWFVRDRAKLDVLKDLTKLNAWADRLKAIGHGAKSDLDAKAALAIAKETAPVPPAHGVAANALGLSAGAKVTVMADDTGRDPVSGTLMALDAQSITLAREAPEVGQVQVHFPRAGFLLTPAR